MTVSSLARASIITSKSDRRTQRICKFTPHYMCAHWTGEQCATYFRDSGRSASANYCIGYDGGIVCNVPEERRAWTSSSSWNDQRAITVECANLPGGALTDATWNSLVKLGADVMRRYGFRPWYDGTNDGTITEHMMFASTDCPGPWLHPRMGDLAVAIKNELDGTKPKPKPTVVPKEGPDEVVSMIHQGDVRRLYSPGNGDHVITADSGEIKSLVNAGWVDEGSMGVAPADSVVVFRLFDMDTGEHFLTADPNEASKLLKAKSNTSDGVRRGWQFEGDTFTAYRANTKGHPVYRLFDTKGGRHLFTVDANEVAELVKGSWVSEGVAFNLG